MVFEIAVLLLILVTVVVAARFSSLVIELLVDILKI